MPEQSPEQSIEILLASVWSRREAGINLPMNIDLTRPISQEDVEYLRNSCYPYLQIINVGATSSAHAFPRFKALANGWVIYDYEEAMCTSLSCKYYFEQLDESSEHFSDLEVAAGEEEDKGGSSGGCGTITMQQFDAAYEMISEALLKGWVAVEIISGSKLMQFYAWVAAQELGVSLYGFIPTSLQQKQYQRIAKEREKSGKKFVAQAAVLQQNVVPK